MTKKLLFIVALFMGLTAYGQGFDVKNYSVDIDINADGFFDVQEVYDVNFTQSKRGVYRDILLKYDLVNEDGSKEKRSIEVSNIEVDEHKFQVTSKFERRLSGDLRIRIGDPDVYLTGPVDYNIRYRVKNAFLNTEEADLFYWNLKPSDWNTTFEDMQFSVKLPEGVEVSKDQVFLYSGYVGIIAESDDFDISIQDGTITGVAREGFNSYYGQAVTLLVKMPPGSIAKPDALAVFWSQYGWSFFVMGFIGFFYGIWRKYGKDDHVPMAISYFPPKDIDPAMAGFLIDDKQDTRDLISLIPYWGHKGYISIKEIDKQGLFAKDDTEITKLKALRGDAPSYERKLFNGLFGSSDVVLVSSLRNSFYSTMNSAKTLLKKEAQKYYEPKSKKVQKWVTIGLILSIFIAGPLLLVFWGFVAALAMVLTIIVLLILNFYMIKKNVGGNEIFGELKGFKKFIKTAEERKLESLIKQSPNYFESTMAFALSFGALKAWTKKFDGLDIKPPQWYHSSHGSFHSMNSFSNSFNKAMSSTSTTMISTPSSSGSGGSFSGGGGFSGGGFGGGGGGSW